MSESNREDTRNDASSPGVNRRSIIAGAAWSIPVVASVMVVPAATASVVPVTCPTISHSSGLSGETSFQNLQGGTNWQSGSTGTFTMTLGNPVGSPATPAFGAFSSAPVSITVTALTYTVTVPVRLNWTTTDPNWTLVPVPGGSFATGYQYTATWTGGPVTTMVTSTTYPGTTLVPAATFVGTIIPSSIPNGTYVGSGLFMKATSVRNYTPIFSGAFATCSGPAPHGASGSPRVVEGYVPPIDIRFAL